MFPLLSQTRKSWWRFFRWYRAGEPPWDSGIVPPEVVDQVPHLKAGRALDIGCGTGTTSVYLAQQGWHVTGIDFIRAAVRQAKAKARGAGVANRTQFVVGDVTKLASLRLSPRYDLAIDIGCSHAVPVSLRTRYVEQLAECMSSGALLMSYMHYPREGGQSGLTPEEAQPLYSPHFDIENIVIGDDTASRRPSAWYWMRRH
jgi:cyclopropane fatty-acyl-phospholipid synthase-like methyltransferase